MVRTRLIGVTRSRDGVTPIIPENCGGQAHLFGEATR